MQTNQEISASILCCIRRAALGEALRPFEQSIAKAMDSEAFKSYAGSTQLDKMLGSNLAVVLGALNDNLWAQTG